MKRYILVGIPKIGKTKLANDLALKYDMQVVGGAESILNDAAFGALMDYRDEIMLASIRAQMHLMEEDKSIIFDGSLFDSFAHSTVNLDRMTKYGSASQDLYDRALMTAALIGGMMTDSVKQDYVFFLEREIPVDPVDEDYLLQKRLQEILDEWRVNYMILEEKDKENWVEHAEAMIDV